MFILFLCTYAWKDWYKSLCGLILLMAVVEHPDFPKSLGGVQGLNPWNIVLLMVVMAWAAARRREGLIGDMPPYVKKLLYFYVVVIVIAFFRLAFDMGPLEELAAYSNSDPPSLLNEFSEGIINCIKWIIPGLLLFDGCRTEKRFRLGTYCVLAVYFLLAIQVIRWMPLSGLASGGDLAERSIKILEREVGYHRVNMAMLLAGGCWAVFCARLLPNSKLLYNLVVVAAGIVFLGLTLTGGRMGLVAWAIMAIIFGFYKWRKILVLAPIGLLMLLAFIPAVQERLLEGFTEDSVDTNVMIEEQQFSQGDGPDLYTVTAGRTFAWPFVLDEILQAPLFGHGREGMRRTGVTLFLLTEYSESFPHPHNAYLQWMLDNGLIGMIPVFLFFLFIGRMSLRLFLDEEDKFGVTAGGVCLALVLALLISSMGSQTFYPREGAVSMWAAIGLALRVYVQKQYAAESKNSDHTSDDASDDVPEEKKNIWSFKAKSKTWRTYSHA